MRVFRQYLVTGAAGKPVIFAYIRANWFERRVIRAMMRARRHNLRPSHNWPGPMAFKASFVMRRKGVPNPDMGAKPGPHPLYTWLFTPQFTNFDALGIGIATLPALWDMFVTSIAALTIFVTVAVYLKVKSARSP